LNDLQLAYWNPTKWVARLRSLKTDSNPLLLLTNMAAGHGGSSGRYDYLKEWPELRLFVDGVGRGIFHGLGCLPYSSWYFLGLSCFSLH
jgi:Prolyl oligopeptidase family